MSYFDVLEDNLLRYYIDYLFQYKNHEFLAFKFLKKFLFLFIIIIIIVMTFIVVIVIIFSVTFIFK